MARETKVGLLIALSVILLIGIIISDHLAVTKPQEAQARSAAAVAEFAPAAQQGIHPAPAPPTTEPTAGQSEAPDRSPSHTAPRLIAPDRFAEPTIGPASRQLPDTQAADAQPRRFADLPSPPPAWRKVRPETTGNNAEPEAEVIDRGQPGIAVAETPSPESLPAPAPVRRAGSELLHEVQPGDTLASIAVTYYRDSAYADTLAAANRNLVQPDGSLTPGHRLVIPDRAGHIAATSDTKPADQVRAIPERRQTATSNPADEPPATLMSTGLFVPATGPAARGHPDHSPALASLAEQAQRQSQAATVTVEPGDSLSKLAERHLGSQAKYLELFEANRNVLDSPDKVVVGMELKLPAGAKPRTQSSETSDQAHQNAVASITPPSRPAARTVTVQAGDNLSRIAERTLGSRDRWNELYEANRDRLDSPDRVKVGQELRVPG